MKKRILAAALAVCMLLTLAACGGSSKEFKLVMVTGGTTGTYYALGGAIAAQSNKYVENVKITANTSGASMENARLIASGEADLAMIQNDVLDYADKGTDMFTEGGKLNNLSVVATLYPEVVQIIASKDSGIKSVADMKGKKVSVGAVGSGVEANARQILAAYGIDMDKDLGKKENLGFAESADAFKNKNIDAFFVTSGVPNTSIVDLGLTTPFVVVGLEDAKIEQLKKDYPFYAEYTIGKDVYSADADAKTIAVMATLIARKDLDTDAVYAVTKAIFDNLGELGEAHAKGKSITPEIAVSSLSVAMHPGAEKYFKETGAIK